MERDFPDNYNEQVADILEAMSLSKGRNMVVIGSGALRPIIYAGDYDANEILKQSPAQVAKGLKDVVRRLRGIPKLIIGDIKLGGTVEEPRRWKPDELLKANITGFIKDEGLRKIDAVANINGRYIEFSTVYMFPNEELNTKDYIMDLQKAAREKIKDGNYWKALKRWFSIQRLRKVKKDVEALIPIFNGDMGILYSVMSDIEVLMYLIENKKGDKELIRKEIANFKDRLSHIWNTPEFQKKEPKFLEDLEKAEDGDFKLLERIYNNFWTILQGRAKGLVKKYVKRLHGGGLTQSKAKVAPVPVVPLSEMTYDSRTYASPTHRTIEQDLMDFPVNNRILLPDGTYQRMLKPQDYDEPTTIITNPEAGRRRRYEIAENIPLAAQPAVFPLPAPPYLEKQPLHWITSNQHDDMMSRNLEAKIRYDSDLKKHRASLKALAEWQKLQR